MRTTKPITSQREKDEKHLLNLRNETEAVARMYLDRLPDEVKHAWRNTNLPIFVELSEEGEVLSYKLSATKVQIVAPPKQQRKHPINRGFENMSSDLFTQILKAFRLGHTPCEALEYQFNVTSETLAKCWQAYKTVNE